MPLNMSSQQFGGQSMSSSASMGGNVIRASHMSSAPNMNVNIAPKMSASSMATTAPKMSATSTPPISTPTPKLASTPQMSFQQMQSQSIEMEGTHAMGGTRRGEAPMVLPASGTITNESITAISAGKYKPGTLGHYQKQSVSEMQGAGRSPEFITSHLNQATAMKIPNYNLPADQAKKAFAMAGSGRTQSFIRGKLGLSASTPVPGKDAAKN